MYDSRFKLFTPGDTYIVYPGIHSSRRFEHIIRGVQDVAKIETLRKEYKQKRNQKAIAAVRRRPFSIQKPNTKRG